MKVTQHTVSNLDDLKSKISNEKKDNCFGIYFAPNSLMENIKDDHVFSDYSYPIIGCSTSGEISENGVSDDSIVFNLCQFDSDIRMEAATVEISDRNELCKAARSLAEKIKFDDMKVVLLFAVGVDVNGSEIVKGFSEIIGPEVAITGGLAGDNASFIKTFVGLNDQISDNHIVAVGLGGAKLNVGYGSRGGWQPFGPERTITKADNNVLFTIDGEPALDIYKTYLGDKVNELPGAGLLYPFAVESDPGELPIIRTILGIDEEKGSLLLAGDVVEGKKLKLMHTGTEGLVEGAKEAATLALESNNINNGFGILVSCVGRKIVMGTDVDDEIDVIKDMFGSTTTLTGFYSHGEICPHEKGKASKLHNQTMTITLLSESA